MKRSTRFGLIGAAIVTLTLCVAVLVPGVSGAWPWDDDREIQVSGQVQCKGFDIDSDVPFYPYARVEGFEIRGRSNVATILNDGWNASYKVSVPPGWVVEWSVKCSNSSTWTDGAFEVSKTTVGSSYTQTRHVCVQGGIYEPCVAQEMGSCLVLLVNRQLPVTTPFGVAFRILYNKFGNDTSTPAEECLKAVLNAAPNLSAPEIPTPEPTATPIPTPTYMPEPTIEPLPEPSSAAPEGDPTQEPTRQPTSEPPGETVGPSGSATAQGAVNGCNTYGQNCEGNPIYVNVPAQGYNYRTEPKIETVANGSVLTARCWAVGGTTYNWAVSQNDPGPNPYDSDIYFSVQASNGSWGFIPDTYFVRDKVGKLALTQC